MASLQTNRWRFKLLDWVTQATSVPTAFYVALITNTTPPTVDHNTFSELTEIAAGNGYVAGGESLTPGATDFDTITEDDSGDLAFAQIKDIEWVASGGSIPTSGSPARFAILTDDNATQGDREVYHVWDLGGDVVAADTQGILLRDLQIDIRKPA
jgi:hypothetical protein